MTAQDFFDKYNNKGIDYDGAYGNQCVDLYDQYCVEVIGCPIILVEGAKDIWDHYPHDYFDRIANTPDNFPQKGDVIIWGDGVGPNGHVAVVSLADTNSFTSFDQNWPMGTNCHFQYHTYRSVLGWLRPKGAEMTQPTPQTITDQTKIHIGINPQTHHDFGDMEVGAVRSTIFDQEKRIDDLAARVSVVENSPSSPSEPIFHTYFANLLYQVAKALG